MKSHERREILTRLQSVSEKGRPVLASAARCRRIKKVHEDHYQGPRAANCCGGRVAPMLCANWICFGVCRSHATHEEAFAASSSIFHPVQGQGQQKKYVPSCSMVFYPRGERGAYFSVGHHICLWGSRPDAVSRVWPALKIGASPKNWQQGQGSHQSAKQKMFTGYPWPPRRKIATSRRHAHIYRSNTQTGRIGAQSAPQLGKFKLCVSCTSVRCAAV